MYIFSDFQQILDKKEDAYLKIKVIPGAGKSCFLEALSDGTWKIALKAQPEKGKANLELVSYLAKEFKLQKNQIEIISGKTARVKLVKIKNKN